MKVRFRPYHAPRFRTEQASEDIHATTLPVLGFRQTRNYTCGFAAALMVVRYFDAQVAAKELFDRLRTGRDGTRQSALLRELRGAGLRVNARYDVDFARVRRAVERNKLIIGYLHDDEHWLVIYGFGLEPERVFVADPEPGEGTAHVWQRYGPRLGGFGIICSQAGEASSVRQTGLALVEPSEPAAMAGPPPLPASQLRCEVHQLVDPMPPATPTQLTLPFAAGPEIGPL